MWVGITNARMDEACVDTEVPVSQDAPSTQTFRGDTLFVLDRRILGDASMESWLMVYRVSDDGCDWLSTEPRARG